MTRPIVSHSVSLTSCTDSRMATERSVRTSSITEGGSCACMRRQQSLDFVDHGDDVRTGLLQDRERDAPRALIPARRLVLLDAVVHAGDVGQPDGIAVSIGHDHRRIGARAQQLAVGENGQGSLAPRHRSGGQIDVGRLDRGHHFVDADAVRGEFARVHVDADGILLRSDSPVPARRRSPSRCAAKPWIPRTR